MRPSQEPSGGPSHTPIYDALYSEYRRSFRALPGDRTGEESLGLQALGTGLPGSRAPMHGLGGWQRVGRHAGHARPAALPPGSRDA
ncbi:hypothetical protein [Streptomyces sp. NBC_00525]|uniref:hypothetical protein n=1 Tax=Streptomyces sp. NBC_00525 TaxID=2903660 RepID=UPI002E80A408|nr:hypothetical protein [Streptomyces sp. NBC_00525]WUC92949.1 hypothetical protein OG710_04725 [Streptomyces sp. NBC_00525]